jgi:hypothetical protein
MSVNGNDTEVDIFSSRCALALLLSGGRRWSSGRRGRWVECWSGVGGSVVGIGVKKSEEREVI